MTYPDLTTAEVIADSVYDDARLVTFRATFPRFILAEFNTHRAFSRNSASSRAIPVKRQIELVRESPFVPQAWPKNRTGMSAVEEVAEYNAGRARFNWYAAMTEMVSRAEILNEHGVHKQIASRLLEPFMWHTVIISSTMPGLDNFFAQRDHEDAQPEMQTLARAMRRALGESTPADWHYHIPFNRVVASNQDYTMEQWMVRAVARCARVSYGREMEEKTYEEDVALVERLIRSGHWSPLEHVGIANPALVRSIFHEDGQLYEPAHVGNFARPWAQLRHHWREYLPSIAANITK
jgi:thymidylate synthase ThyX